VIEGWIKAGLFYPLRDGRWAAARAGQRISRRVASKGCSRATPEQPPAGRRMRNPARIFRNPCFQGTIAHLYI